MRFHPFEVSIPHIAYAALGGFVVIFGMFSLFIREKLYIGEACWAFLFGVIIGPYCANIFDPRSWGNGDREAVNAITLEFTRVVLAIGVFAVGVELPKAYMQRHWKSLAFLLIPVMTWGWFVSAGLIFALIPGLNFLSSLAVAACLTPTDPILAAAVIGGKYADKHVPAHLRHLLAAESGCNDGAAFPFLFLALYLIVDSSTGRAVSDWFLLLWLYEVVFGIIFGSIIGFAFRHLMKFCERKDLIDRQSYVAQYVSLALLTIGSCTLLGTDDLLAAFSCGTAFAWDGFFNRQTEESVFSSVIDLLFNIAAFVFVGAWMPFKDFQNAELTLTVWRLIVLAILVLLLRRLPVLMALYKWIPDVKTFREAVFSGHFGPMGIGAVFISTLAAGQLATPESPPQGQEQLLSASIQPIVAFMVLCSITIHGLSIPFFSLGRRVHSVTRTWSRHDTLRHHQPEWATAIRQVMPGEDIVINRDSTLERGEFTPDDKRRSRNDSATVVGRRPHLEGESSTTTQDEKDAGDSSSQDRQATRENGEDSREQNPPDGTEVHTEWREGPDKIVENRAGPGEEVDVEVQRNAYGPDETLMTTFHGAEDAASAVIHDVQAKFQNTRHEVGKTTAELAQRNINHDAPAVEATVKDASREAIRASSPKHVLPQEDEEEGWMSDRSNGEPSVSVDRKRSKSPKHKPIKPVSGKHRLSIRRGVLGTRAVHAPRAPSDDAGTLPTLNDSPEGSIRGRTAHFGPPYSLLPTNRRSLRHDRIDSLRSLASPARSPRELSPARSVHFADGSTPRSPSTPETPQPGSEAPSGDEREHDDSEDSPRSQVRFNLPSSSVGGRR